MDEKIVVLAALLGLKAEDVDKAWKDEKPETFVGLLNTYKSTLPDIETIKKNIVADRDRELEGLAKQGKLPSGIYNIVKGSVFEMDEKEIATEYGIKTYTSRKDLISQIATKGSNADVAKLTKDLEEVKGINLKLKTELENKDSEYQKKYTEKELTEKQNKTFDLLESQLKGTVEEKKNRRTLLQAAFNNQHKVVIEDGKMIVYEGDKALKNVNLDPLPLEDVAKNFVTKYGFEFEVSDPGGRGEGSPPPVNSNFKGMDESGFNKYCAEKKIISNTAEHDKAFADWKAANKT